jgi:serine phosphatase RsbU (regulator of sigma subunit)
MELLILGPEGESKTVALQQSGLSLGRSSDNDLSYPNDPWLSRYHLFFEREGANWTVRDCESRNGTIINAVPLRESHPLRPGDRIYAGHLTIEVRHDPTDSGPSVVSFVTPAHDTFPQQGTVVTNLEKVLGQTKSFQTTRYDEITLTTTRVVRALIRAGQELSNHRPLDKLFELILDLSLSAVDAARGVILILEKDNELIVRSSKGANFNISTSVRDRVLTEKCSLMISDAQLDEAFREQKSIVAHKVRSVMAVPLQAGDRVIGLIYVDTGNLLKPFSQEDLDLLTVMANVAAIRIEQARLIEVEQSEKLMESELASASEIQLGLLPTESPHCEGYEIAGVNLPCHTVGGDYYDYLPYSDGRLAIVVGDVAGKGLAAALMMSSLQARVHMLAESSPDPAAALTILNRNVAKRCPLGRFITFFYGVLNPATGSLQYANAGHNHPLLLHADGSFEELAGHAMVMGILPDVRYQPYEVNMVPGDMLALFSDGVTESRTPDKSQEFGEKRLAAFLAAHQAESPQQIIDELISYVRDWSGKVAFGDDFTMVIVKRH